MKYNFLRFPGGKYKAVTFSYDDGTEYDIHLSEIMNKYGIKGTFNICSYYLGDNNKNTNLSPKDLKEYILEKGHEVAIHGDHHRAPGLVSPCMAIQDILDCRRILEKNLGIIIKGMAYPDSGIRRIKNGNDSVAIKNYLKDLGIVYSRTLGYDNDDFEMPVDFLEWKPTAHHENPEIFKFIDKFNGLDVTNMYSGSRQPKLFYLWGHSNEFEKNNNWDLFETICSKLSGQSDTWYATNMEIYTYVNGYNNLIYSTDEKTVYNPNLFDIWFEVDKNLFCVKSGETIRLEIKNEL